MIFKDIHDSHGTVSKNFDLYLKDLLLNFGHFLAETLATRKKCLFATLKKWGNRKKYNMIDG